MCEVNYRLIVHFIAIFLLEYYDSFSIVRGAEIAFLNIFNFTLLYELRKAVFKKFVATVFKRQQILGVNAIVSNRISSQWNRIIVITIPSKWKKSENFHTRDKKIVKIVKIDEVR